ncbi:MAG: DUF134 domain-containing protein [Lachnospiraceae bacterium]|nr:DUF134 domain-containing protein [Lachnospiraceae bacterium]
MARPQKFRYVCNKPKYEIFSPECISQDSYGNILHKETVILSVDEYEVFRLLDYENITQKECAFQMKVARTTVTDIYNQARQKIADSIVNGKRLLIEGGNYELCARRENCVGFKKCFESKCKNLL